MRLRWVAWLFISAITFCTGYAICHVRRQTAEYDTVYKSELHERIQEASLCGSALFYLTEPNGTKASRLLREHYLRSIEKVRDLLASGVTPFFNPGSMLVGVKRGRDYLTANGFTDGAGKADDVLSRLEAIEKGAK